jgi:thioredoxin reductase (NADPH)
MESFETLIIGAGPAGLSCALELTQANISCVVIERSDRPGGQLWEIDSPILNFAGGFSENGTEIAERLQSVAQIANANIVYGANVEHVEFKTKTVRAAGVTYRSKSIVLATGQRTRRLHLPGESTYRSDIVYTRGEIEQELDGKKVIVIGGNDFALSEGMTLSDLCENVTVLHRSRALNARKDLVEAVQSNPKMTVMLDAEIDSLAGEKRLASVQIVSGENGQVIDLPVNLILIKIGYAPNTELFRGHLKMDQEGYIAIDRFCETSAPGIYAIGDITDPNYPRISAAMGHGTIAAANIRKSLLSASA